ncbi:putative secreted RxLR effector protein [Phytophthora cinnamomi]|uniref:putative secreted RxLR effector protein n=1 Tax=Phytophthora cinnamomi TaxID=4785 RepID=UPI0035597386|nr:putative secreted RxLR effector protein [Phytophthora cinnamomi]
MRLGYLLLTAAVAPLLINGAASEGTTPEQVESFSTTIVQNNEHGARLLRGEEVDADDEDRATIVLDGLIKTKAESKALISSWVSRGFSVEDVAAYLRVNTALPPEQAVHQWNWAALKRFERLKGVQKTGLMQWYAYFGSVGQTKKKTQEILDGALATGASVDDVATLLHVKGLSNTDLLVHPNYRAFKRYEKMHAQYQEMLKPIQFSYFGSGYHTKEKTKEIFDKWAMQGTPVKDVKKTLGLKGLSGEDLTGHVNYDAFLLYRKVYNDWEPIRAHAAGRAGNV